MAENKKTLYEILEVPAHATELEIQAAYRLLTERLEKQRDGLNNEHINFQLKVINVAFRTLSVPRTRKTYDERLALPNALPMATPQKPLVATAPSPEVMALKADAMSLRADAISLKADAVTLRAEAMSLRVAEVPQIAERAKGSSFHHIFSTLAGMAAPFRVFLTVVGGLIAMGMVIQVAFLLMVNRQAEVASAETAKTDEKVILQQYYQEHGVMPASRAEADMLDMQRRREERELQTRKEEERRQERSLEEARRYADQISNDLRRAEEEARREQERQRRQQEQEKRDQEEAERLRIEHEMNRWRGR